MNILPLIVSASALGFNPINEINAMDFISVVESSQHEIIVSSDQTVDLRTVCFTVSKITKLPYNDIIVVENGSQRHCGESK